MGGRNGGHALGLVALGREVNLTLRLLRQWEIIKTEWLPVRDRTDSPGASRTAIRKLTSTSPLDSVSVRL